MSDLTPLSINHAPRFAWTDQLPQLAQKTADILVEKMRAEAVWLFGSVARGESTKDSDIDLLVILPHSDQPRHRRSQIAHSLTHDIHAPKDFIVLTRQEWNSDILAPASLVSTVQREGICLHERSQ